MNVVEELKKLSLRPEIRSCVEALKSAGGEVHLVGGSIRDLHLKRPYTELDLTTNLSADAIEAALIKHELPAYRINREFQTVLIPGDEAKLPLEITSFRTPVAREVGSSLEIDLGLRDFTINAIAFSLASLTLKDPTNGAADLSARIIRAVGSNGAQRFEEDPLRILRMVRFAAELNFAIDSQTFAAAKERLTLLERVSSERVRDEFLKILLSPLPRKGFELLNDLGFLEQFVPEIFQSVGVEQNRFHSEDVFAHTLSVVEKTESEPTLRLAALVHDLGKPGTLSIDPVTGDRHFFRHEILSAELGEQLMKRLKFSNREIEEVSQLAAMHMRPATAGPAGLRRLLRDTGELFPIWRKLKEADSLSTERPQEETLNELKEFDEKIAVILAGPQVMPLSSLAVDGRDLMQELNLPQSPKIGVILRQLHEEVLDEPERNEREYLLARAKSIATTA